MITNSNFIQNLFAKSFSNNTISSSFFYGESYFREISDNTIENSQFNVKSNFQDNSYTEIKNSTLTNVTLANEAILNFTSPASNITTYFKALTTTTVKLYGYVDMPPSVQIFSGILSRYYPIHVVYNNTNMGVFNKTVYVNETLTRALVNYSITDPDGWAVVKINFNSTNYGEGNFTLHVNPSSNISLFTDTPITISVADTTPPSWSNNQTTPISGSTYSPGRQYKFQIDWIDNVAIDTVLFEHNFTGTPTNATPSDNVSSTYYYLYFSLPAGTYYWKSYANDTTGNSNSTPSFIYIVSKAPSTCSLTFDKTSPQTYPTQINASCSCTNPEANPKLYRNGTDVTNESNQLVTLPAGTWYYVCNVTETQNYTSASNSSTFIIEKADPSPYLHLALNGNGPPLFKI